jgi:acyl-CoA reductase-like NAD-dependent aldehyde dehydrogenase
VTVEPSTPQADIRSKIVLPPTQLLIDGRWEASSSGQRFDVVDPATEQVVATVARAGDADVLRAVAAARRSVDGGEWSRLTGADRSRLLLRLADLLERDAQRLADLDTLDIGQPGKSPAPAIAALRYYAGWADKIDGRYVSLPDVAGRPTHTYVRREPVGVVGAITPWNGPLMIGVWKMAPALAAGCSVVIKPSEDAPLSTLYLGALALEAGFPPGALNVVPGYGHDAGAALVAAPGVDKVSFTGSAQVGCQVGAAASGSLKAVTLELGGKSPQLLFADADIDRHIPAIAQQIYQNGGQVCVAGTRILVERGAVDQVVEGVARAFESVRVGDPFDPATQMGPLINQRQFDRVVDYISQGRREQARLVTGGERVGDRGFFLRPTLFAGDNRMVIAQEEIFGPVGIVIPFDTFDEVIRLANDTPYGLAATVYTRDISTAHRAAAQIRAGMVRINGNGGVPAPSVPFGGLKGSGIGRELSYAAIDACTTEKTVSIEL